MEERTIDFKHNNPPSDEDILREKLNDRNYDLIRRVDDLEEAATRMPDEINDDVTKGKFSDFISTVTKCAKTVEAKRNDEKAPYIAGGRIVDAFFNSRLERLDKIKKRANTILTNRLNLEAQIERKRLADEAAALKAKADAEAAAAAAQESANLPIKAEETLATALNTEQQAARTEQAAQGKLSTLAKASGTQSSATLRTTWKVEEIDRASLDLELLRHHISADAIQTALNSYVRTLAKPVQGQPIRGARVYEHSESVVR